MLAAWRPDSSVGITPQAGVIVIDTQKDTATIVKDTRCGYVRDGAIASDGLLYMATESYGASVYRVAPDKTPKPCMLRFDLDKLAFDTSFFVELKTIAGGSTGGLAGAGANGATYLRVLDETIYPVAADTNPRVLASASAWKWWQVQFGANAHRHARFGAPGDHRQHLPLQFGGPDALHPFSPAEAPRRTSRADGAERPGEDVPPGGDLLLLQVR